MQAHCTGALRSLCHSTHESSSKISLRLCRSIVNVSGCCRRKPFSTVRVISPTAHIGRLTCSSKNLPVPPSLLTVTPERGETRRSWVSRAQYSNTNFFLWELASSPSLLCDGHAGKPMSGMVSLNDFLLLDDTALSLWHFKSISTY